MEKEGHKHPLFKELLKRSEVMREILQALFKQQKKQVAIASSLKKGRWNFVSEIQEKRLVRSLRKEQDLVTVLAGVYKHEKERVKAIFEAYEHEKKKQAMVAAAAVALPVLRIIQRRIDRQFDREHYVAQRVVDDFGESLRTGTDPLTAAEDLTSAVERTLQPVAIGVWTTGPRS